MKGIHATVGMVDLIVNKGLINFIAGWCYTSQADTKTALR